MSRIAVTGAAGPVGSRLCRVLLADDSVSEVRALDRVALPVDLRDHPRLVPHPVRLRESDLDHPLAGVDVVCHLAGSDPLEEAAVDHDLHATGRVLDAAARAGVGQVIVRTSATVYGAWSDNPVPLTEADPLRPNPESAWVQVRASIEARVAAFAEAHPGIAVATVRPTVTVSESGADELGRVLAAARLLVADPPPVQFVHVDDVASAVDAVRRSRAEGPFNVAPDGSIADETVRALVGGAPRVGLPAGLTRPLRALGWRYRLAPTPPGFEAFAAEPWVVANDRLKAIGWQPSHGNDEAFVAGHAAAPWAQISPRRRQEAALAVTGAVLVGAGTAGGLWLRRRLRGG